MVELPYLMFLKDVYYKMYICFHVLMICIFGFFQIKLGRWWSCLVLCSYKMYIWFLSRYEMELGFSEKFSKLREVNRKHMITNTCMHQLGFHEHQFACSN